MATDDERRRVAAALRGYVRRYKAPTWKALCNIVLGREEGAGDLRKIHTLDRLADLIEPSYKPDAEYEAWYNSLSHFGDEQGGPSTIRELIEEIVWAALTVDLGPNGNTDPSTGIDEGDVYTNKLFAEWEREALRLSGGCDRDALLELAEGLDCKADDIIRAAKHAQFSGFGPSMGEAKHDAYEWRFIARRIREALGEGES